MLTATVVFAITAGAGHADYVGRPVGGGSLVLTLSATACWRSGGWLGGAIVFVHGMRVLNLVDEPTSRAVSPLPSPRRKKRRPSAEEPFVSASATGPSCVSMAFFGCAPIAAAAGSPSLKSTIVGIEAIP